MLMLSRLETPAFGAGTLSTPPQRHTGCVLSLPLALLGIAEFSPINLDSPIRHSASLGVEGNLRLPRAEKSWG